MDVLFISPDSSREVYQGLADKYAAIEPQPWALLLAGALRKDGYSVGILDPLAEGLDDHQAYIRIANAHPRYICFVVYGQNPNSGTTNMAGAERLLNHVRLIDAATPVIFIGSHPSALPNEVAAMPGVDYVCPGDGLNGLKRILTGDICGHVIETTLDPHSEVTISMERVIWGEPCKTSELDYAWDLVDLSRYRCHTWHNNFGPDRSPFASIYTSLGCNFKCDFCMINMVNKSRPDQLDASQATGMRYFAPEYVLDQLEYLQKAGVKNVRIADEMFFLNRQHYLPIVRGIVERGIKLNLWAYARVDTVRREFLPEFKSAGISWLCLGIESANRTIRREITKGSFEDVDVRQVAREIKAAGINLLANFIFGLPDESEVEMQETLDLALEIGAEHTNFYPCMALPGSPLYRGVVSANQTLPDAYSGYSFHSYDCQPMATNYCTASQVLAFRDRAWLQVSRNPRYLEMIADKFGQDRADSILAQTKIPLKRRLLESS